MFGGMEGVGAEDAWYSTALEKELSVLEDCPFVGGSLDLFKCFDQIIRPLLYVILLLSGLPRQILAPYINYLENLKLHNSVAGSLGKAHWHPCGIPQGCPFSMVFISLYLRAWICQMHEYQAVPRTLADDLLLTTTGPRALHLFKHCFTLTIKHLQDMGGRLSPHKSKLFSTVIPVVHQLRDLGASLCTTSVAHTGMSQ
eukprot:1175018-Karenia_brevis.AAC.1